MKIFLQGVKKKLTINKVYNQTLYKLIIDIKRELQPYVSAEIVIKHMMMLDKRERKNTLYNLRIYLSMLMQTSWSSVFYDLWLNQKLKKNEFEFL